MCWKMCNDLHVKYPLFLSDFNEAWIFSTDFRKNTQIWNVMKIRPLGADADGQTDRDTVIPRLTSDPANEFFG